MTQDEINEYGLCFEDACDCGMRHVPELSEQEMEELSALESA